jgi:hypothetical protein
MENLLEVWNDAEAAQEFVPLPAGKYHCRLASGKLMRSKKGNVYYRLLFEVIDGEYAGRCCSFPIWLTSAAMPFAKRDLKKISITDLRQLDSPVQQGLICEVTVALRKDDNGEEFNRVRSFLVVGTDAADVFAPMEAQA